MFFSVYEGKLRAYLVNLLEAEIGRGRGGEFCRNRKFLRDSQEEVRAAVSSRRVTGKPA